MKISPTTALVSALLTTVLCTAGCGKNDVEAQFEETKTALVATQKELAKTKEKLREYQDAEAEAAKKETTTEWALPPADVLALQSQVLSRLSPTLQVDPILTTAQKNSNGQSFYHSHGTVNLYNKGPKAVRAELYISSGKYADNTKGQQQWYLMDIELKKDPQDNQIKLFLRQIELSMEGKGQAGFLSLPKYKRGFTAEDLMKDQKLAALAPLVQFLANEAVRAGLADASPFTKLIAARGQAANDVSKLDISRALIQK